MTRHVYNLPFKVRMWRENIDYYSQGLIKYHSLYIIVYILHPKLNYKETRRHSFYNKKINIIL